MASSEIQSNRFELPETWERIELSGFLGDRKTIDYVKYFLTIALRGSDKNLSATKDKITIKYSPDINNRCEFLGTTLNKMIDTFPFLEPAVY